MTESREYYAGKAKALDVEKKRTRVFLESFLALFLFSTLILFMFSSPGNAAPIGPDSVAVTSNETKSTIVNYELNVSGGYITDFNITATTQNVRWKAMVGHVSGTFTLDDAGNSTLYDWSIASITGEVFATRNSSAPIWANIKCANETLLELENVAMSHTDADDNITTTFNTSASATHGAFNVATASITANTCATLNTYQNNATQDSVFEEVALTDTTENNFTITGINVIYAAILEDDAVGYDANSYDFQMLVPEIGTDGFSSSTAYYLYVEIS